MLTDKAEIRLVVEKIGMRNFYLTFTSEIDVVHSYRRVICGLEMNVSFTCTYINQDRLPRIMLTIYRYEKGVLLPSRYSNYFCKSNTIKSYMMYIYTLVHRKPVLLIFYISICETKFGLFLKD